MDTQRLRKISGLALALAGFLRSLKEAESEIHYAKDTKRMRREL